MTDKHKQNFENILGQTNVLTSPEDLSGYQRGWRGESGKAAFVLRPSTNDQISSALRYAHAENIKIIPQGANTGLVGASVPDESGTQSILSLDRMNNVISIDPVNRTAHVQAGCRLSKLNAALEPHGLYFPVDLSADPSIGGMIATNTGGSRLLKYGGVRENTLGISAILPTGEPVALLNTCRKNNTGLDLKHIFIGTGGQFGIITEAIINLAPRPQQTATALLVPRTPESVNLLLMQLETLCSNYLSAFEGMSKNAINCALAHTPTLHNPFGKDEIPPYTILLELSRSWPERNGEMPLGDVLENILSTLWESPDEPLENALIGDPHKLWSLRHGLSEGVQKSGRLIAFDIAFKRGDVIAFLEQMKKQLPTQFQNISICDFGHIGDGGVHFNLVAPHDMNIDEMALRRWVYDIVVNQYNGSFSAEHGIGPKNQAFYNLYTPEAVKNISEKLSHFVSGQ